jgi:tRNA pseudouridine38-40 synthase
VTGAVEPGDAGGLIRLRLDLAYAGGDFHGWAAQPGTRTVQGELGEALMTLLRLPAAPELTVAGRTDAGVHARCQVAHVDVPAGAWERAVCQRGPTPRLASLLPPDVRVHAIGPAPDGFHARFSAIWRRYSYSVCDDPARADPLRRRDTLEYPRPLDPLAMNQAADNCLGEHDFAAFCRRRPGASTVRELLRFGWQRPAPGMLVATVVADAFCHNMVRALVGASLLVGDGRREPGWLAELLAAGVRNPAATVAPPHPLCLEEVGYPADDQLAARAMLTRRLRGPAHEAGPAGRA